MADVYTDTYFDVYGETGAVVVPPRDPPPPPGEAYVPFTPNRPEPLPPELPAVRVWRRNGSVYEWVTDLTAWESVEFEPRYLQAGGWKAALRWGTLTQKVERHDAFTFDFRTAPRYTGFVANDVLQAQDDDGFRVLRELSGLDALARLNVTGWPDPTATPPRNVAFTQAARRWRQTGPAETVLRDFILANYVDRLGEPLTIAPSQGRGATITVNSRWENVLSLVQRKCANAGLGFRMGLVSETPTSTRATMVGEFFESPTYATWPQLSPTAGTLRAWKRSDIAPNATRALVAGGGVGVNRILLLVVDDAAEERWQLVREIFVDARDETDEAALLERGQEALLEATSQSSFELESSEAEGVRYGVHLNVGDIVPIQLVAGGAPTLERIGAARIAASVSDGVSVHLIPGNPDGARADLRQAALTRGLRRQLNNLQTEEE